MALTEQIPFEVDGHCFRAVLLDGEEGRGLLVDLLRMFGPSLLRIASGSIGPGELEKGTAELLGAVMTLRQEDVTRVVDLFGKVTEGQLESGADKWRHLNAEVRKEFFRGRQKLQAMWFVKSMQVQFADFFGSRASG